MFSDFSVQSRFQGKIVSDKSEGGGAKYPTGAGRCVPAGHFPVSSEKLFFFWDKTADCRMGGGGSCVFLRGTTTALCVDSHWTVLLRVIFGGVVNCTHWIGCSFWGFLELHLVLQSSIALGENQDKLNLQNGGWGVVFSRVPLHSVWIRIVHCVR